MTTRRYNLSLPQSVFDELVDIADKENITLLYLIRHYIKLGILLHKTTKEVYIKKDNKEIRLIII